MPEIQVIKYQGRTSGFQTKDSTLYRIVLKNDDREKVVSEPWGVSEEEAYRVMNEWAGLLCWPIKRYEDLVTVSTTVKMVPLD